MINARYRENMEPNYNRLGGKAGIVDVTSRIISAYSWTGAGSNPLNAVSFDFSTFSCSLFMKVLPIIRSISLVRMYDPWSGFL
ncbi:hypothetical protein GCM10020331_099110 [Ectobacillus funiculus]